MPTFKFQPGDLVEHKASGERMVVIKHLLDMPREGVLSEDGYGLSGGFLRVWTEYQEVVELVTKKVEEK